MPVNAEKLIIVFEMDTFPGEPDLSVVVVDSGGAH